jgi:metal-sulfur cluster biosynthetic enzyme
MGMSDSEKGRPVNPHTGQPVPDDPGNEAAAAGTPPAGGGPAPGVPPGTIEPGSSGEPGPKPPSLSDTAAPSQQEMAIRSALETVMDPEIGLSVIDLGLIRQVSVLADRTHVKMMLTTPFCPYAPQLIEEVKQATTSVVPQPCDVELLPDAWSPDLMPDPGLLGYSF